MTERVTTTATVLLEPAPIGSAPSTNRLGVSPGQFPGLDEEWLSLWNTHGSHMVRADEVTIQAYRENPAAYSFSYPTYSGKTQTHKKYLP